MAKRGGSPNTTALVTLPGSGETHEVGSGSYRWRYPFADPHAVIAEVTLDSGFETVYNHLEAWGLVTRRSF